MRRKKLICMVLAISVLFTGCSSGTRTDQEIMQDTNGSYEMTEEIYDEESAGMMQINATMKEEVGCIEEKADFNTEEYNSIKENRFLSVKNNALSTFSADVDTASYANVRRMIQNGYIEKDAVRIEEFINYFTYNYEQPSDARPFQATTEIMDCPWNEDTKILSVGIKAKEMDPEEFPDSNLVFLLDVSGSMDEPEKLPLMVKAFEMLSENLGSRDRISIVTYAGSDEVVLEGVDGNDTRMINQALRNIMAGGGTNGAAGIETAYNLAEKYFIKGGNNRVILATDGDLNIGVTSEGELEDLITEKAKSGVFLSVLGLGMGNYKDNKMETLADKGNGNYAYIDTLNEARKVLVEQMSGTLFTVAKDVKFQVEFNPTKIKGYRLIGYENRVMNAEDFNDDKKDAGEIGSGHCVTALYELVPVDSKMEIESADLKYQNTETNTKSNSDDWLTVNIRYKEPDGKKSKLLSFPVTKDSYTKNPSENIQFAACVAEFGMLLRDSQYKGTSNYDQLIHDIKKLDCIGQDEYRQEFQELVKDASNILCE